MVSESGADRAFLFDLVCVDGRVVRSSCVFVAIGSDELIYCAIVVSMRQLHPTISAPIRLFLVSTSVVMILLVWYFLR